MLVGFDGKRFKAALIEVAGAGRAVVGVPTLGMGEGEPAEEIGDLAVLALLGPDDHVPMVGHDRVSEDSQRRSLVGLGEDLLEGFVVGLLLEDGRARIGAIEDVVNVTADNGTRAPRHEIKLSVASFA